MLGVLLLMNWLALQVGRSLVPSDAICDFSVKLDAIVVISALVSWHCSHLVRLFHECDLQSGQIMTRNETFSSLSMI